MKPSSIKENVQDIKENLFETTFRNAQDSASSSSKSSRDRVRRALRTVSTLKTIAENLNRRVQNQQVVRKESERKIREEYEEKIKELDPEKLSLLKSKVEEQKLEIERLKAREEEMRIREHELETCSKSFEQCLEKIEKNQRLQNKELMELRDRVSKTNRLLKPTRRLVQVVTAHLDGIPTSRLRVLLHDDEALTTTTTTTTTTTVDVEDLSARLESLNERISEKVAHSIGDNCAMQ